MLRDEYNTPLHYYVRYPFNARFNIADTGNTEHTDLLFVEFTLVLLRDRREMMESPQFTTVPLLMLNVRNRYRSSLCRGLYGRSGSEQTRGRT